MKSHFQVTRSQFKVRPKFLLLILIFLIATWNIAAQPIFFNSKTMKISDKASPSDLKNHVRKISEEFYPRDFENVENLNKAAVYIQSQLQQFTSDISEQKYSIRKKEYKNIIAKFGVSSKGILIVGAHYDSCEKYPAADDNASGVAGLIELARLLKAQPPKNIEVQLVAYSTEEPPFFGTDDMGSFIHAQALQREKRDVIGMISLEMIGYFSKEWGSQDFPAYLMRLFYPSKGNFVAVVSDFSSYAFTKDVKQAMQSGAELPIYSMNGPRSLYGIDYSDHRNYWQFGFPAVMVTDTAFFRNKAYHGYQDTYDRLDYEKMARVVEGVGNAVLEIDGSRL